MKNELCDKDGFPRFCRLLRGFRARVGAEKRPVAVFWTLFVGRRFAVGPVEPGFFLLVTAKGRLELAGAREDGVRAAPGRKGETTTA